MNDTMSLLLATCIIAVGGLGLFMYKSSSDDETSNKDESMFDFNLRSYFGNSNDDEEDEEGYNEDNESNVYEPPKRARNSKTKSARKVSGTKRRY